MPLTVGVERWPLASPFAIARGAKTEAATLVVRIAERGPGGRVVIGMGEAVPYPRYGEEPEAAADAIESLRGWIDEPAEGDPSARRTRLRDALAPGSARNAVDCALWDLEAKLTGKRVAQIAGLAPPKSVVTAFTLSLGSPDAMAQAARDAVATGRGALLKTKLGAGSAEEEAARLRAIRKAAPEARLIADANEGWSAETLAALDPVCSEVGVLFIEQPLPAERDDELRALVLKTPLCADESCHNASDLDRLQGLYQIVNLKLDKTGGLTAALELRRAALERGFGLMVGCMVAGSLAMAPAYLLTEGAAAVDLDGPLLLAADREHAIRYKGSMMFPPEPALWG